MAMAGGVGRIRAHGTGHSRHIGHTRARPGTAWGLQAQAQPQQAPAMQAFCDAYRAQLSPLTVREALKVIAKRSLTS